MYKTCSRGISEGFAEYMHDQPNSPRRPAPDNCEASTEYAVYMTVDELEI